MNEATLAVNDENPSLYLKCVVPYNSCFISPMLHYGVKDLGSGHPRSEDKESDNSVYHALRFFTTVESQIG